MKGIPNTERQRLGALLDHETQETVMDSTILPGCVVKVALRNCQSVRSLLKSKYMVSIWLYP